MVFSPLISYRTTTAGVEYAMRGNADPLSVPVSVSLFVVSAGLWSLVRLPSSKGWRTRSPFPPMSRVTSCSLWPRPDCFSALLTLLCRSRVRFSLCKGGTLGVVVEQGEGIVPKGTWEALLPSRLEIGIFICLHSQQSCFPVLSMLTTPSALLQNLSSSTPASR
jgi:hypothetical protein